MYMSVMCCLESILQLPQNEVALCAKVELAFPSSGTNDTSPKKSSSAGFQFSLDVPIFWHNSVSHLWAKNAFLSDFFPLFDPWVPWSLGFSATI